jgi:hypothetical protein
MSNPYAKAISSTGLADRTVESTEEVPVQQESLAEDASRTQAKINWLESTVTQEIFKAIQQEAIDADEQAHALAEVTPSNYLLIVKQLQKSTTLRSILKTYGSTNDNNS